MSLEMYLLLWTVALTFIEVVVAVLLASTQVDMATLAGNRDAPVELTALAGRAQRAHRNMLESLPLFIALALIAQVTHNTGGLMALGASLFFWGRFVHWLVYLAGIPWLRTLVWLVSMAGLVIMFAVLA